jgi:phosphatidylglycerophosphate synthase
MGKTKTVAQIGAVLLLTTLDPGNVWALTVLYAAVVLTVVSGVLYLFDTSRGRAGVKWR